MREWKNPELRLFLIPLLFLSLVGVGFGFSLSVTSGFLSLALCGMFFLAIAWDARQRYRKMDALCNDLDRLLHGDLSISLDAYAEGSLSVLRNELCKLMTRLREQADLLQKDKGKLSSFLADVSHQLRTPLTAVNLLVARLAEPCLPERQQETVRALRRQLNRIDWLISALLRMSRLDTGTVTFRHARISLSAVLEQAAAPLAVAMELGEQTLQIQGAGFFVGDLAWTAEALGNILKNCMEHTPAGGQICVSLSENPIYSEIIIRDNGPGIDPEDLPHLFERFYRGKNASAQSVGIGLSLARMIIVAQNGTIQAVNSKAGGALFTVRFYKGTV